MLMAEWCGWISFPSSPTSSIVCRSRFGPSIFAIKPNNKHHQHIKLSLSSSSRPKRRCECEASKDSDSNSNDESFGLYPWDSYGDDDAAAAAAAALEWEWVPQERVTLFTSQGLVQIGGSLLPRPISSSQLHAKSKAKATHRYQQRQESDYMDPKQGLCLGALFDIAATNGLDMGRKFCIFGFCRSIEMLSDVVQDTVLEHGGEIVTAKKATRGGLQEKLSMIVAVPLLWGVPPASETLHLAVRTGGGIVEKVYWQWDFL